MSGGGGDLWWEGAMKEGKLIKGFASRETYLMKKRHPDKSRRYVLHVKRKELTTLLESRCGSHHRIFINNAGDMERMGEGEDE